MKHILATSRSWNENMVKKLERQTGHDFYLVTQKDDLTLAYVQNVNPRYVFFPHWSYIVPPEIYNAFECVIFHMTDLPYGRGGSPLQNLIQRGHRKTMLSALRCVSEIDTGPVYLKRPLCLEGSASEIFLRAARITESMIAEIIENMPSPEPQIGKPVYFKRRRPEESDITASEIRGLNDFFDFIRMLDAEGYPRAYLDVNGHRLELSRVQQEQDKLVGTFVIYNGQHNREQLSEP